MTTLDPAAFIKAADILRQDGWRQRAYGHNGGPRCIVGAIKEAKGTNSWDEVIPEATVLRALLKLDHTCQVFDWNDTPGRTVDEVVALLKKAAENPGAGS